MTILFTQIFAQRLLSEVAERNIVSNFFFVRAVCAVYWNHVFSSYKSSNTLSARLWRLGLSHFDVF